MSHPSDITRLRSPVLSQRAEPRYDVIDVPPASGEVHALLGALYPELSRRADARQLVLLTRQRHLLVLSRQCVAHQMSLMHYIHDAHELLHHHTLAPPLLLAATCMKLRKAASCVTSLHRRLRSDPCLYPLPSRDVPRGLLIMAVKAVLLTERLILRVLRRTASLPEEATPDLCRALTVYNQVVADLSKHAGTLAELRPFCLSRVLDILAEERGRALAGELGGILKTDLNGTPANRLQGKSHVTPGLEVIGESESHVTRAINPIHVLQEERSHVTREIEPSHVILGQRSSSTLLQEERSHVTRAMEPPSHVVSGQRSSSTLGALLREERSHVTPLLQLLSGLDQKSWRCKAASGADSALYGQYCSRLWTVLYTQVFHDVTSGVRGSRTPPALLLLPAEGCARAARVLHRALVSEDLPESCVSLGRSLCHGLQCMRSLIAWDTTLCQALSSALTDKCAAPANHSRTAGILVTLCQHLSCVTPEPRNLHEHLLCPISEEAELLSRATVTLHLCDTWLRSHAHIYTASASISQLLLITHGDLPVIKAQCGSLVAENGDVTGSSRGWSVKMRRSRQSLEGLLVSLPHSLASLCSRRARDVFVQVMPAGRHWRGKLVTGPHVAPSEYAQAAVTEVLLPLMEGVTALCEEEQVTAVCAGVGVFMEAWMGHILREKIRFSLQGALQLRRDFESVRDVLRSWEPRVTPEVIRAALTLPAFSQADNAIVCLLQQPPRKTYLHPGGCAFLSCCPPLCRVAVDSMSDSLQSLDSLERRVCEGEAARGVPRHSHDSYLPHHQRQWLSLRLHKTWRGLGLAWEGGEGSEG